jgi:hypothetical protein
MAYIIEISLSRPRNATPIHGKKAAGSSVGGKLKPDNVLARDKENQKRQICKKNCILKIRASAESATESA